MLGIGTDLLFGSRPNRNQASTTTNKENGLKLFKSVYDPHTEKLLAKLQSYHPDFAGDPDFSSVPLLRF